MMMMLRMVIMTLSINAELIHNKLVFFLYDKINDHISSVRHVMMLWQDDSWMIRSTSLTPHLSPSQDDIFTSLILSKKLLTLWFSDLFDVTLVCDHCVISSICSTLSIVYEFSTFRYTIIWAFKRTRRVLLLSCVFFIFLGNQLFTTAKASHWHSMFGE